MDEVGARELASMARPYLARRCVSGVTTCLILHPRPDLPVRFVGLLGLDVGRYTRSVVVLDVDVLAQLG